MFNSILSKLEYDTPFSKTVITSSVAIGGLGYTLPSIGLPKKCVFRTSQTVFCNDMDSKVALNHFRNIYLGEGLIFVKTKVYKSVKLFKMAKINNRA